MSEVETKILASALYELRLLLGCTVKNDAPHELQLAWRLAYALHNDAMAAMEGKGFDHEAALARSHTSIKLSVAGMGSRSLTGCEMLFRGIKSQTDPLPRVAAIY